MAELDFNANEHFEQGVEQQRFRTASLYQRAHINIINWLSDLVRLGGLGRQLQSHGHIMEMVHVHVCSIFNFPQEMLNSLESVLTKRIGGEGYIRIDGSTPQRQRADLVKRFQEERHMARVRSELTWFTVGVSRQMITNGRYGNTISEVDNMKENS